MPLTLEEQNEAEAFIDNLETPSKTLTRWELNFLEEVSDEFIRTQSMSPAQFEKLKEIHEEKA